MKPLKFKLIIKILEINGFVYVRQTGSHYILKNFENGTSVIIPFHGGNRELTPGTFQDIIKQSKLPKEKFLKK
jgi:predicted RNA binding protein YcfA (HicA-like mRNA interferase family)